MTRMAMVEVFDPASTRENTHTFQIKVKATLRLTVSQSVSLGVEPQYLLLFESYGLVFVGRPL
jgi:hypothetical protein